MRICCQPALPASNLTFSAPELLSLTSIVPLEEREVQSGDVI